MWNGANKAEKMQIVLCVLGVLAGIGMIGWSILILLDEPTMRADRASFGADFYTEIYRAARIAANNLSDMYHLQTIGILGAGICAAAGFGVRIYSIANEIQTRESYIWHIRQLTEAIHPIEKE